MNDSDDPREYKPWPPEQDCPGCPGQKTGPHRFGCAIGGARGAALSAVADASGTLRIANGRRGAR